MLNPSVTEEEKRELIKKIRDDPSITKTEKNLRIQKLMMGSYCESTTKSNESKECEHYTKQCYKFYFECCGIYDPCTRCHRERDCGSEKKIKPINITCSQCEFVQSPTNICSQCGIQFAQSYCDKCLIWTSKQIYHCVDCGICRIGSKETLFHCVNCGICFNKSDTKTHNCVGDTKNITNPNISVPNYKDGFCTICSTNTFNSQSESFLLDCGHFVHQNCYTQYIQQGNYKCAYCKKSVGNMGEFWEFIRNQIKLHPLPKDLFPIIQFDTIDSDFGKFKVLEINYVDDKPMYFGEFVEWVGRFNRTRNNTSSNSVHPNPYGTLNSNSVKKNIHKQIHCNDCGKKSSSQFHFYGLECGQCGSFNTQE